MKEHPQISEWLTEDYTEKDAETTIQQLKIIINLMDKMASPGKHIKPLTHG